MRKRVFSEGLVDLKALKRLTPSSSLYEEAILREARMLMAVER